MDYSEPVSPQMQRSIEASERSWRNLEKEFGLFSIDDVTARFGKPVSTDALGVIRDDETKYPGYQFDENGNVYAGFISVVKEARGAGWKDNHIALWMTIQTGYLEGLRPVDCISDAQRLQKVAQNSFHIQW